MTIQTIKLGKTMLCLSKTKKVSLIYFPWPHYAIACSTRSGVFSDCNKHVQLSVLTLVIHQKMLIILVLS